MRLRSLNPRTLVTCMVLLSAVFWFAMGATALMAHQVFEGVPDRRAISRVILIGSFGRNTNGSHACSGRGGSFRRRKFAGRRRVTG